jgi:GNAT superfamily N-acetyltransferase
MFASLEIRNLTVRDVPNMLDLEKAAWPEGTQASQPQLLDRLGTFQNGFLGAFSGKLLVGMASSQIIDLPGLATLESWTDLTADGWISKTHQPGGDCIHFVSICVHPRHRGEGVAMALNRARLQLAKEMGLHFALTDTRLPGLARFLSEHAELGAAEYIEQILAGKVAEPVVNMYLGLGFKALGLVPDCMKSDAESAKFGLAMLKALKRL